MGSMVASLICRPKAVAKPNSITLGLTRLLLFTQRHTPEDNSIGPGQCALHLIPVH